MIRNQTLARFKLSFLLIGTSLGFFSAVGPAQGRSFLDPLYESFDVSALRSEYETSRDVPALAIPLAWALVDSLTLQQKIHEAARYRKPLLAQCEALSDTDFSSISDLTDRGLLAYTCALAEAEALPRRPIWATWSAGSRLEKDLKLGRAAPLANEDRWFAEGRLFALLPPSMGQNYGKALVALETLRRLHPESSMVDFYLAWTYAQQGNEKRSSEALARALDRSPPDPRAKAYGEQAPLVRAREVTDGSDSGIVPQLFYAPALGVGGGILWFDDRLADTDRMGRVSAFAASRGTYGTRLSYSDGQLLEGARPEFQASVRYGIEDFYGLGSSSTTDQDSELTTLRTDLRLSVKSPFWDYGYLRVGWRYGQLSVKSVNGTSYPAANVPQSGGADHNGPWAELGYDSLDSAYHPTRGLRAYVRGYFPTEGLGSSPTFSEWVGEVQGQIPLSLNQGFSLRAVSAGLSGSAPYAVYPTLGGTFELPGVRDYRFQDRSLGAVSVEYQWRVVPSYRIALFGNIATLANEWDQLFQPTLQAGGGLAVEMELSRWHSEWFRAELGYFGNQAVFQVTGGRAL